MPSDNTLETRVDKQFQVLAVGKSGIDTFGSMFTNAIRWNDLSIFPNMGFPSQIRGGVVDYSAAVNSTEPIAFEDGFDVSVLFDYDSYLRHQGRADASKLVIVNTNDNKLKDAFENNPSALLVDLKNLGGHKNENTAAFGMIAQLAGISEENAVAMAKFQFEGKDAKVIENAGLAISKGWQHIASIPNNGAVTFTNKIVYTPDDLAMPGNDAVAYGLYSAGTEKAFYYQITPATSAAKSFEIFPGVVALQSEDELAAINSAIGSSFAGKKTAVFGSGPTTSLSLEALGSAIMTETPLFYYVAQRVGPGTGFPTGYSQSDLLQVLFGEHGSLGMKSKIVAAAANVDDAFNLAVILSGLSEYAQVPSILLGDMSFQVGSSVIKKTENRGKDLVREVFMRMGANSNDISETLLNKFERRYMHPDHLDARFKITPSLISPAIIPGMYTGDKTFNVTSHSYRQDGGVGNGKTHPKLMYKLLHKLDFIHDLPKEILYREDLIAGRKGKVAIVGWGTTEGAIIDAVNKARKEGYDVDRYHAIMMSHLPKGFLTKLNSYEKIILPEANSSWNGTGGQLAMLLAAQGVNRNKFVPYNKDDATLFTSTLVYKLIEGTYAGMNEFEKQNKVYSLIAKAFRKLDEFVGISSRINAFETQKQIQIKLKLEEAGIRSLSLEEVADFSLNGIEVQQGITIDEYFKVIAQKQIEKVVPDKKERRNKTPSSLCPGCTDESILTAVLESAYDLGIEKDKLVVVSGIGCSGRLSLYVNGYGFHSLHGRALPTARGIADANPELHVVVIMGDNDAYSIGAQHIRGTAALNPNLTAIVIDNGIAGLTKGQFTAASRQPHADSEMLPNVLTNQDPLYFVIGSNVPHVAQSGVFDYAHMVHTIKDAMQFNGMSWVNILSKCHIFADDRYSGVSEQDRIYLGWKEELGLPAPRKIGSRSAEQNFEFRPDYNPLPEGIAGRSKAFSVLDQAHLDQANERVVMGTLYSEPTRVRSAENFIIREKAKPAMEEIYNSYKVLAR